MKVWILERDVYYEGQDILAVCATPEVALQKAKDYIKKDNNEWEYQAGENRWYCPAREIDISIVSHEVEE